MSTATAQQDVAWPVAEATYIPPPVRDLGAQGADQASTVGSRENDTPSAVSTTDAAIHADTQAHNDTAVSQSDTGAAESPGSHEADDAATPGAVATPGSRPNSGTVLVASADHSDVGQTAVLVAGDSNAIGSEEPDPTGGTPYEISTASPEQQHASAISDRSADGVAATRMPMADATGTAMPSSPDAPNGLLAVGPVSDAATQTPASGETEAGALPRPISTRASIEGTSTAPEPSTLDTGSPDSMASGTAVEQSTGGDLPGQDASDADAVQRYKAEDLGALMGYGSSTNHALYEGPDGRMHAVGDEVGGGLYRDKTGRLRDAKAYVSDDNKLPPKDIDAHAERGQPLDRMPVPTDPDQTAKLAALQAATRDRAEKQATKAEIWDSQVEPLVYRLEDAGLTIDRNTFASAKFQYEFAGAARNMPRDLKAATTAAAIDYSLASRDLVDASEKLGVAGGGFVASLLYPDGQTLTSSDGVRGVKDTLDRTVYDGSSAPMLIIIEEKGAGSTLGVRKVSVPNGSGEKIIAQQCSPEYVHDLLENDTALAGALQGDPQLYRDVQGAIEGSNGGAVECLLVHTSAEGAVNVVPCVLDPKRFRRETIRIPSDEGAR